MQYETGGDPVSGLKWTRKTTEKVSQELVSAGINVSKTTVGKILKKLDFSLKSNRKIISNGGKRVSKALEQKRDSQFNYIKKMRDTFYKNKLPVESVDTKKKELIGNFKNEGIRYKREADLCNDHDFLSYALGKAALYGVYDQQNNRGFVSIGMFLKKKNKLTSSDTPEFAVESIERWWVNDGIDYFPDAKEILILADGGGSNGHRVKMWKVKIQQILCNKYGFKVTVCHFPPGASKWNPIEHRLFSEISKNWRGTPLIDYETVLNFTRTTITKNGHGLKVNAVLVSKQYQKGVSATKKDLESLNIKTHDLNPEWNYTISPN